MKTEAGFEKQAQCYGAFAILAFWRLKQEEHKFAASLDYIVKRKREKNSWCEEPLPFSFTNDSVMPSAKE